MTNEKARDFFSAYHEGTLESGLRVSFEQKLKADADLRREFDSFVRAMDDLDVMKFEEIAIPDDLHERISARLDRHIYDKKRSATPHWTMWLRGLGFAGVGAAAILGAIFALNSSGGTNGAIPAGVSTSDQIAFTVVPDGVNVTFAPNSVKTIVITNAGKEVARKTIGDATSPKFKTLLSNTLPNASVFGVQVDGDQTANFIALPGRVRSSINKGDGTIVDMAKAVSDFYRMPVSLSTSSPQAHSSWTFTTSDPVGESSKAAGATYSVTLLQNGMLEIDQK
ncbi:MAG TPA: hypothetical protein VHE55_09795 [Fimbriimonadaceae bacterium]|nr:hypothetical protein [Fimbriimonadaceae bacterium]